MYKSPSEFHVDTINTACSVETCPQDPLIFACGTYQVVSKEEGNKDIKRKGTCDVFKVNKNSNNNQFTLNTLFTFHSENAAIPDMKWCHNPSNNTPTIALSDSKGYITILEARRESQQENYTLEQVNKLQCYDPDLVQDDNVPPLCLSLDWSNRIHKNTSHPLAASLSNGDICIFSDLSDSDSIRTWKGHDFEAWIAAWDYWNPSSLWTGGDDCKLKRWDTRLENDTPVQVNKRFDAGVTTIQCSHLREHIFAVGSYDENVRIFDARKFNMPVTTINVSGGVWRNRWHPTNPTLLAVASMHDGFKILDTENQNIITTFEHHESLAYGCDWVVTPDYPQLIASCSFYDHALHLWKSNT